MPLTIDGVLAALQHEHEDKGNNRNQKCFFLVHTHGGTNNITSFNLVSDDRGIENYIQHWESLELIWVMATCTFIFYIFLILKLEYSIGEAKQKMNKEFVYWLAVLRN